MSRRHLQWLTIGTAAILAAGCRDSVSPRQVTGTYVLARIGDDPVPAVAYQDGSGAWSVLADTLRLGAEHRGSLVLVQVTTGLEAAPMTPTPLRLETGVTYGVRGSRVEVTFDCPINASCLAGPHMIGLRSDRALLMVEASLSNVPLYFRKVAEAH